MCQKKKKKTHSESAFSPLLFDFRNSFSLSLLSLLHTLFTSCARMIYLFAVFFHLCVNYAGSLFLTLCANEFSHCSNRSYSTQSHTHTYIYICVCVFLFIYPLFFRFFTPFILGGFSLCDRV